jgi:hypothetical protein
MSSLSLPTPQVARLEEKLLALEKLESLTRESYQNLIFPCSGRLKKMKIRGNVALRPLLVLGPRLKESEITFLLMAQEKDRKYVPRDAEERAERRLQEILNDERRRKRYYWG